MEKPVYSTPAPCDPCACACACVLSMLGVVDSCYTLLECFVQTHHTVCCNYIMHCTEANRCFLICLLVLGVDFTVTNTTMMVVITSDQQSLVVEGITIVNDTIVEMDETFTLSLGLPIAPPTGVSIGIQSQITVTIRDNEGAYVIIQLHKILE